MESHCSLIKSFARRREGARSCTGEEREEGTASETETKENGGRGGTGEGRGPTAGVHTIEPFHAS